MTENKIIHKPKSKEVITLLSYEVASQCLAKLSAKMHTYRSLGLCKTFLIHKYHKIKVSHRVNGKFGFNYHKIKVGY